MARQRFIWPTFWDDLDLGRLSSDARLLYIGCFSLADDEGRIIGDPVYLRSHVFRYRNVSNKKVEQMLDELLAACSSLRRYNVDGTTYLAFLNWGEFQKPKYPTPSKIPPPFPEHSGTIPQRDSTGLGRDRKGRVSKGKANTQQGVLEHPLETLLESLPDKDDQTRTVITKLMLTYGLTEGDLAWAKECATGPGVESPVRVAVAELRKRGEGRAA